MLWCAKKIEDSTKLTVVDMNKDIISGEKVSASDIVSSCNLYPFGDEYRLVIVKGYNPSKNKDETKIIQDYLNAPLKSTILVFFNPDGSDFFKSMSNITMVDCNKIDSKFIYAYIKNILSKNNIDFDDEAIEKLILYCNSDMSKVANETEKLSSYLAENERLTTAIVEEFVSFDKEFQVFQLAEFLAKGDAKNAIDLVDSFSYKPGSAFSVISPLYNNYRRALFVSLNKNLSNSELATNLGVKEFAIRSIQNQVRVFAPKKLKKMIDNRFQIKYNL